MTKPNRETLVTWLEHCRHKALQPNDDPFYVDLSAYAYGGDIYDLRGKDAVVELQKAIEFRDEASHHLFSGFSGTGKTTELNRLKYKLEHPEPNSGIPEFTVIYIDFSQYHDLKHELNIEDLLSILAGAIGEQVGPLIGKDVLKDSYWDRLKRLMTSEIQITEAKITGLIDFKALLKHGNATVWGEIREKLQQNPRILKENAHNFIEDVLTKLAERKGHPKDKVCTVVIVDSLEKLAGSDQIFLDVLYSLIETFVKFSEHLYLPQCHVIYTVPPYATLLNKSLPGLFESKQNKTYPAIKVSEITKDGGTPFAPGIAALKEILSKRIDLKAVFASDALVEKLIRMSGGHLRHLLLMTHDLIETNVYSEFPLNEEQVDDFLNSMTEDLNDIVRKEGVSLLYHIHQDGSLKNLDKQNFHLLAQYIDGRLILCYRNGNGRFELNPLLIESITRRYQEIQAKKEEEE